MNKALICKAEKCRLTHSFPKENGVVLFWQYGVFIQTMWAVYYHQIHKPC